MGKTSAQPLPSLEDLEAYCFIDPSSPSGLAHVRGWGNHPAGRPCGTMATGGWMLNYHGGRKLKASRVVWKLVYGIDPVGLVEHKDLNCYNNSIGNLRLADYAQNAMNRTADVDNELGVKGVCRYGTDRTKKKYRALIVHKGKQLYLGCYNTVEEAAEAYAKASQRYHGEYGRTE